MLTIHGNVLAKNWGSILAVTATTLIAFDLQPAYSQDCGTKPSRWLWLRHKVTRTNDGCAAPEPTCEAPVSPSPAVAAPVNPAPASPPGQEESENQPFVNAAAATPAMFSAPATSGEITGATNGIGIRLPALTIPEMRLQLPTVHLPSIVRTSRDAEMYVDGGRAPRVTGAPAAYGQLMNAGIVPQSAVATASATLPRRKAAIENPAPATANANSPAPASVNSPTYPAPAQGCTPFSCPPVPPSESYLQTNATEMELIETRRELIRVSERLQRLQGELESASKGREVDKVSDIPPAPTSSYRRNRYSNQVVTTAPAIRKNQSKIVGASYSESEVDEYEEFEPSPSSANSKTIRRDTNNHPEKSQEISGQKRGGKQRLLLGKNDSGGSASRTKRPVAEEPIENN